MPATARKVVDERLYITRAKGGGILRREIWVDRKDRVVRHNLAYALAYVNPLIFAGDNGRVLGYDSAHGTHHRHYKGRMTTVAFGSFEEIEARFQTEWTALVKEGKCAKH